MQTQITPIGTGCIMVIIIKAIAFYTKPHFIFREFFQLLSSIKQASESLGSQLTHHTDDVLFMATVEPWRGAPDLKATLRLFNMNIFRKCVQRYDTGLGESYMDGDFEVDNLGALMAILARNVSQLHGNQGALGLLNWIGEKVLYIKHKLRPNTVEGSRKNIEEHYDSGNDMYRWVVEVTFLFIV